MTKLSVRVNTFTPLRSNTLRGFIDIIVPEMHLRISDCTVHESHGKRWIGLPAKPQMSRDGQVRRDERGKAAYGPVLAFTDKATRDTFSARAIAALLEDFPDAFADGVAS